MPDGNQMQFIEDLTDIMTQTQIYDNLLKLCSWTQMQNKFQKQIRNQSISLLVYSQDISAAFIRRYY